MGKFIGIGARVEIEKGGQVEGLGDLVQIETKRKQRHLKFEVDRKEIFSYSSKPEQAKVKAGEKKDKKGCKGQSVR